jgi:general secretion pathway protein D
MAIAVGAPPLVSLAARAAPPPEPPSASRLLAISASELPEAGAQIRLRASGPLPRPRITTLEGPARLVLDLPDVGSGLRTPRVELGFSGLGQVRVGKHAGFLRVVVESTEPATVAALRLVEEPDGLSLVLDPASRRTEPARERTPTAPPSRSALETPDAATARLPESLDVAAAPPRASVPDRASADEIPSRAPRVYGMELETRGDRDRLLVFATQALVYRVEEVDPETVRVRLPGAVLDAAASRQLAPTVGSGLTGVRALERKESAGPEVWIELKRVAGTPISPSQRGSILALELPREASGAAPDFTLQFEDTDIADVVRAVSEATGEPFLFDGRLQGKVTIAVADRVTREDALEILNAALLIKGFAALPTPGGPRKILPIEASAGSLPWTTDELSSGREAPVITRIQLTSASVDDVVGALRPYLGESGLALAHAPSRSVILAGSEARLRRWMALAQAIDETSLDEVWVRRVRHRSADELAEMLPAVLGEEAASQLELVPDARSNALVVRSPVDLLPELRNWVDRLDVPADSTGSVRVLRLDHADPDELAVLLQDLTTSQGPRDEDEEDEGVVAAAGLSGRPLSVAVHRPTRSLVVAADATTHERVNDLVAGLDRPRALVGIEATVMEVTTSEELRLGVDAFIPLTNPKAPDDLIISVLSNPSGGGLIEPGLGQPVDFAARFTREPLVFPVVSPDGTPATVLIPRETVVVTAAGDEVTSRLLMRPHLVAVNGDEQEIFVGNNVPILTQTNTGTEGTEGNPLVLQTDVEREDVGVRLHVRPTVGQAGGVRLELELDVRQVVAPLAGDVDEVGPTLRQRQVEATLFLRDGEFAVVGMGADEVELDIERGVPFLKDMPWLGSLFRFTMHQRIRTELVIAVQAWVHRNADERVAAWIQRRMGVERSLARVGDLRDAPDVAYAVLVATRPTETEAETVAGQLEARDAAPVRVTAWDWRGDERFDVYLTGFQTMAEAGAAANRLIGSGYRPRVVALPDDEE